MDKKQDKRLETAKTAKTALRKQMEKWSFFWHFLTANTESKERSLGAVVVESRQQCAVSLVVDLGRVVSA